MQRIVVRDWSEAAERPFSLADRATHSAWSIDAAPQLVARTQAAIVAAEHPRASGPLRVDWQGDVVEGTTFARCVEPGLFRFELEVRVKQGFVSQGIGWSFELQVETPRVLCGRYRLVPARPRQHNCLTPLALVGRNGRHWIGVTSPGVPAGHAWNAPVGRSLAGTLWLDHPVAHPRFTFEGPEFRNWHSEYKYPAGAVLRAEVSVMVTERPVPLFVLGRFPARRRAVLSITDHADHDSYERVTALWYGQSRAAEPARRQEPAGFVGLKLPLTKSIFTATPQPDGPGLHHAPFIALCREGHEAGIEICPHGVHSSVQPPPSELERLLMPFLEFKPRTWIDHGNRFLSNYGRRGWNRDDEYSILPWLDRLGIHYVWGRLDFGQSVPRGRLNQAVVEPFRGWSYLQDLPLHTMRSIAAGRPWAVAHGLSSLAYQLVPEHTMRQYVLSQRCIQRVMRADVRAVPGAVWESGKMLAALALPPGLGELYRHLSAAREEVSRVPIFFPEHDAVARGADDRWLFNTVAVHDVQTAYSPAAVDRLLDDYGIHLSHTYLTSVSRAHVSHAIEPDGSRHWRLARGFERHLQYLAERRDEGTLWVTSMGELGDYWRQLLRVQIRATGLTRWELSLPAGDGLDVQLVALGQAVECRAADAELPLQSLDEEVQVGALRLRPNEPLSVECRS